MSVLRVPGWSWPAVKVLYSCKDALNPPPPPPPNTRWFTLLTVLRRWSRCWSYSLLLCGLFFEAICFMSYLLLFCSCVFQSLLALQLPRLGKRKLILVLFIRLFDLCLFGFVDFFFLLVSGKGCGLWLWHSLDFSFTFFFDEKVCFAVTKLCSVTFRSAKYN